MPKNKFKQFDRVKFLWGKDKHEYWVSGYMQNGRGDWIYSLERAGLKSQKAALEAALILAPKK